MPAPKTATQLQKFLRLVTYLSPFIPSLSSFTAPLCGLLKKGTEFLWNNSYQKEFNKVKSLICKDTTLWYFNICKPATVHIDASQKGLGAAILQDGCPVALFPKLLHLWSSIMPTKNVKCLPQSLEQNHSTPMSLAMPSLLRMTTSLLNRSTSRIWQIHQYVYREHCSDSKTMMSPSSIDLAKRCWLQMPSLAMHPSKLQRYI